MSQKLKTFFKLLKRNTVLIDLYEKESNPQIQDIYDKEYISNQNEMVVLLHDQDFIHERNRFQISLKQNLIKKVKEIEEKKSFFYFWSNDKEIGYEMFQRAKISSIESEIMMLRVLKQLPVCPALP